jgi:hypothetical protein
MGNFCRSLIGCCHGWVYHLFGSRIEFVRLGAETGAYCDMNRRLDGLTTLLLATVFAASLLYSCAAKRAPREVTVTVPADYSGEMTLDPCGKSVPGEITLSARGTASTAVCPEPGETVSLTVIKGGVSYRISSDDVTIERAGDGLPVAIKARVR